MNNKSSIVKILFGLLAMLCISVMLCVGVMIGSNSITVTTWVKSRLDNNAVSNVFYWDEPVTVHSIANMSGNIRSLWRSENIYIYRSIFDTYFGALEDKLFFVGSLNDTSPPVLTFLDMKDGTLIKGTEPEGNSPTAIATDSEHIYIGHAGRGIVICYSIQTGEKIWEIYPPKTKSVIYLSTFQEKLLINSSPQRFTILNKNDRSLISSESLPPAEILFFIDDQYKYFLPVRNTLQAVDLSSGTVVWSLTLDDIIAQKPVFSDGIIGVRTNDSPHGVGYLINATDGTILWQSEVDISGNLVFDENLVYFLDQEARLNVVDYHTNELLGFVDFSPVLTELDEVEFYNRNFYVAAKGDKLFAYFGDSLQLFAFEFDRD